MQIHQIKPTNKLKKGKRIGRGGKKGTYSGRGMKGQKSRAGHKKAPAIREVIKKYHKLRGYRFNPASDGNPTVNISDLERKFNAEDIVSPEILAEKGMVRKVRGELPTVKILGNGIIKKPLTIKNCLLSRPAAKKIEEAGGKIV